MPKEVLVELDLAKHEIQYHSLVSKAELVLKDMSDTIAEVEIGELHNHVSSSSIGLESTKKGQIINRELKTNLEFDDEVMDRLRESLSVSLELRALLQQNGVNNNARLSNAYTSSSVDWDSLRNCS